MVNIVFRDFTLLSSNLYKFDVENNDTEGLMIRLHFRLLYSGVNNTVMLRFSGIREYSFYYHHRGNFYNVERYKLLKMKDGFYISLDPFDETGIVSPQDQDFILCEKIEGFLVNEAH